MFIFKNNLLLIIVEVTLCAASGAILHNPSGNESRPYSLVPNRMEPKLDSTSCFQDTMTFFRDGVSHHHHGVNTTYLSNQWWKAYNSSQRTFHGAEMTIAYFQEGKAYKVLLDRDYSVHRFLLRNKNSGEVNLQYETEETMLDRFATDKTGNDTVGLPTFGNSGMPAYPAFSI